MQHAIPDSLPTILQCPHCGNSLRRSAEAFACEGCATIFPIGATGLVDFRLQRPKKVSVEFILGTPMRQPLDSGLGVLPMNQKPEVDFSTVRVPVHLSRQMLSYFPKARGAQSFMLDLGCGNAIHREVCEHAGFQYVGLDYGADGAPMFGDAHALPFKDESFEFILCIAVLEHIRQPVIMMKEASRVLQPNGLLIGTVSFLEPFHQNSFYHHTHLGAASSLEAGAFEILHLCPDPHWSVLVAQANMALFPKMPPRLATALVQPLQLLHKLWWRFGGRLSGRDLEKVRLTMTTGAFTFIARKRSC